MNKTSTLAPLLALAMMADPASGRRLSRPHVEREPKQPMTRTGKRAKERRARQIQRGIIQPTEAR